MSGGDLVERGRDSPVTRAITVRLDEADHAALQKQAQQIGLRPGTLARIMIHAALSESSVVTERANALALRADALAALERLVRRSQERAPADAVALVTDARDALEPDR